MKTENTKVYNIVHSRFCTDSECFDSNGDSIIASYSSKEEALKHFKAYLEQQIDDNGYLYDLTNIRMTQQEIESKNAISKAIEKAVALTRIEFNEWSVKIEEQTVFAEFTGL